MHPFVYLLLLFLWPHSLLTLRHTTRTHNSLSASISRSRRDLSSCLSSPPFTHYLCTLVVTENNKFPFHFRKMTHLVLFIYSSTCASNANCNSLGTQTLVLVVVRCRALSDDWLCWSGEIQSHLVIIYYHSSSLGLNLFRIINHTGTLALITLGVPGSNNNNNGIRFLFLCGWLLVMMMSCTLSPQRSIVVGGVLMHLFFFLSVRYSIPSLARSQFPESVLVVVTESARLLSLITAILRILSNYK